MVHILILFTMNNSLFVVVVVLAADTIPASPGTRLLVSGFTANDYE